MAKIRKSKVKKNVKNSKTKISKKNITKKQIASSHEKKHHKIKKIFHSIKSKFTSIPSKLPKIKEKIKQVKIQVQVQPKQFEVITPDGVDIKLNFYDNPDSNKGIILLPMLGKTKESMDNLAQYIYKLGYKVVAVDYRGHGGSELNWQSFRSKDFANMVYDAKAAKQFLDVHKTKTVGIIGASIGANVALNYLAMDPEVKTAILLSPGIDYRGVKIDYAIPYVKVPIFIFTSKGDQYSFISTQHIQKLCSSPNVCVEVLDGEMHGMELLSDRKTKNHILKRIEVWLNQYVK